MNEPDTGRIKDARMAPGVTPSEKSGRVSDRIEDGTALAPGETLRDGNPERNLRSAIQD